MSTLWLIYVGHSGLDFYPLLSIEEAEGKYEELLEKFEHEYYETTAIVVEISNGTPVWGMEVFLSEHEV